MATICILLFRKKNFSFHLFNGKGTKHYCKEIIYCHQYLHEAEHRNLDFPWKSSPFCWTLIVPARSMVFCNVVAKRLLPNGHNYSWKQLFDWYLYGGCFMSSRSVCRLTRRQNDGAIFKLNDVLPLLCSD